MNKGAFSINKSNLEPVISSFVPACCDEYLSSCTSNRSYRELSLQLARVKAATAKYKNAQGPSITSFEIADPPGLMDPQLPRPIITHAERVIHEGSGAIYILWGTPGLSIFKSPNLKQFEVFAYYMPNREMQEQTRANYLKWFRIAAVSAINNGDMGATLAPIHPDGRYHLAIRSVFNNGQCSLLSAIVVI